MNVEIKGVHFDVKDPTREFIQKKIHKIDFAKDLIVDLLFTLTKEKQFLIEATINFKKNHSGHIKVKSYDLHEGIDRLIDKLEKKVRREKEKIKQHP